MLTDNQRESLYQFFLGNFHQDWPVEAKSAEEVLERTLSEGHWTRVELEQLSAGIVAFLEDHPDEAELEKALYEELGCYYYPPGAGQRTRAWLLEVAARLRRD